MRAPICLYTELDLVLKTARDLFTDDIEKIVIDDREEYDRLRRFVEIFMPERVDAIELYQGEEPIFDAYGIAFLYGVSKFLFTALALAVILALFASYVVAMTVIPLFCARYLRRREPPEGVAEGARPPAKPSAGARFHAWFDRGFTRFLDFYERTVRRALRRPGLTVAVLLLAFVLSFAIAPFLGVAFFPRTDAGQFTVNLKVPTGTRTAAPTCATTIRNCVDDAAR